LRIDTDDRGYVTNVSLEESSGHSILDEAAMEAVRDWKLEPKEGGRWGVTVTLKFELD
jgi:TonB family protein